MGMFDTVVTNCPKCRQTNEIQTKAGDRCLDVFDIDSVPVEIARNLHGQEHWCDKCGHKYKTIWPEYVPTRVKMKVESDE